MIAFKKHSPGISFIEVLVALMMVSAVILATFKTQMTMLRTTSNTSMLVQAVAAIDVYFAQATRDAFIKKEGAQEKILEFPAIKLVYTATPTKDSSVFKNITGLMVEKVTATWTQAGREQDMTMVRFTYKPAEQEEEKKSSAAQPNTGKK
jgi:Tfp pilus assembly protein PilV